MSLAPPTLGNALPIGARLWRIEGRGTRARLREHTVVELAHHYARLDSLLSGEWIDGRELDPRFYRDRHSGELELHFTHHPLGALARRLFGLVLGGGEIGPLRASKLLTKRPAESDPRRFIPADQSIAGALRLLARLGHAERLPVPKRCPKWIIRARWVEPAEPEPPQPRPA